MSSNNNHSGGFVIKKQEDEQELKEYSDTINAMNVEDFIKMSNSWSLEKSYSLAKRNLRVKILSKYYNEWLKHAYIEFYQESINNVDGINSKTIEWLHKKIPVLYVNNIREICSRYESIRVLLNNIQFSLSNRDMYTCTVFNIQNKSSSRPTNYAYLYSIINVSYAIDIEHKYVCTGPNLISSDGEYRNRFTSIYDIGKIRLNFADLCDEVEEFLIGKKDIKFSQNYYLSHNLGSTEIKELKTDINNNRFAMTFYIIAWLSQGLISHLGLQNKHIDSTYNVNMFDEYDDNFIIHLIEIYGMEKIKLFYQESSSVYDSDLKKKKPNSMVDYSNLRYINVGQKIIPLTTIESACVRDIKYSPWREIYISELINKLYINIICPGIPLTHGWFYVHGVNKHIFNNPDMYEKIEVSDEAREVVEKLRRARTAVYHGIKLKSEKLDALSRNNDLQEEELIVSDVGINIISEYVGRTVNDIASSLKSEEFKKSTGSMFSDTDVFFKYMFDIVYALLCMNTKLNVIHGDLHLNNTTIHYTFKKYIYSNPPDIIKNLSYSLVIFENDLVFIFKNTFKVGTVLDFSRSFILLEELEHIQSERILSYYNSLFPGFMKIHGDKLRLLLMHDFNTVYKIFSAIDMYVHTDRLLKYIDKNSILQTHEKSKKLVVKINNITKYYLEDIMEKILNKQIESATIKYPNYDIIMQCFGDYILKPAQMAKNDLTITEMYFYKNDMLYSLESMERLPPRFRYNRFKKPLEDNIAEIKDLNRERELSLAEYYEDIEAENKQHPW